MTHNENTIEQQHNTDHQDSLLRYQIFIDERKELLSTAKEAAIQYAKAIMTLSAGALALSLTFMKDIAPNPLPNTLFYLKTSWFLFCSSLIAIVISFLLSEFAFIKQVEIAQKALSIDPKKEDINHPSHSNPYKKWIVFLNILSLLAFILGVILIVLFSASNLKTS